MHLIETRNLCYVYKNNVPALDGIDFVAPRKASIALLGPNGAGKSTLFKHFNGILKPTSGEVLIRGEPITKKNIADIRKFVGIVFQNPDDQIFSPTVEQDIAFGPVNLGLDPETVAHRVDGAVAMLGLEDLRSRVPHQLSGGEKKRVAIAGVVAMEPQVMVLDEPTAGLDPGGVEDLLAFLKTLPEEYGMTIIFSTHQVDLVPEIADLVYVMNHGRITGSGTVDEIFSHEELLNSTRLHIPPLPRLIRKLRRDGVQIDMAYRYSDAEAAFFRAFGRQP
ncbi:MAG: Energy-coupling factor transporter ATP-binding protein EcfA [Methanomicrobiales archaeon 53_19]|jgi:cobalt/nickel transport system ATP-binding protein|uniref:ATP-binding cassette domain-containing protein n=1 Tax=Methanocalculus sp. TaxID=2004547 RepID=UPI0007464F3A|nr:ATP-binding cassette domain-containing protein [Methanocalculus sp.]KUK70576.1 MAG: Energy-coupling factor transporter ATP-binding protein EcfA [Methanocalculus sp. 52_23]KUL05223.1 MAG: Energy-coupling factor transporter ATP-binding protein EcfA [Methanomicrobiales archaeon 53_19]HIJ05774.1 ATP-binding cassette domain-containing protein [Methanocalculus sp.]